MIAAIFAPALLESRSKLKPGVSLPTALYLLCTCATLAWGRLVLFDILQLALGYPPSAGLIAGASLVALSMAQIPLLQQRFPHAQSPRRAMAAVAAFGVMLAFLRPPLPEKVSMALSNERSALHVDQTEHQPHYNFSLLHAKMHLTVTSQQQNAPVKRMIACCSCTL